MSELNSAATNYKDSPALKVAALNYVWPGSNFTLQIEELCLERSCKMFIYGPSGSGKTTLLNLVCGILKPSLGSVQIGGINTTDLSAAKRDQFRARHMGVVFQQLNLIPFLSVKDNLLLPLRFARIAVSEAQRSPSQLLTALGLPEEMLGRRADSLSVGQQQRVALARALITSPDILIADEPTSALDEDSRDAFIELMSDVAASSDTAIMFVSHDRSLAHHFDRQLSMQDIQGVTP